jgi:hypothetical protein
LSSRSMAHQLSIKYIRFASLQMPVNPTIIRQSRLSMNVPPVGYEIRHE